MPTEALNVFMPQFLPFPPVLPHALPTQSVPKLNSWPSTALRTHPATLSISDLLLGVCTWLLKAGRSGIERKKLLGLAAEAMYIYLQLEGPKDGWFPELMSAIYSSSSHFEMRFACS